MNGSANCYAPTEAWLNFRLVAVNLFWGAGWGGDLNRPYRNRLHH